MFCRIRDYHLSALAAIVLGCAAPVITTHAQTSLQYSLPAQPLADSLRTVASRAKLNMVFDPPVVADRMAPSLQGQMTTREALSRLLEGSGLAFEFVSEGTVAIHLGTAGTSSSSSSETPAARQGLSLARSEPPRQQAPGEEAKKPDRPAQEDADKTQEIIVTAQKRKQRVQDIPMSVAVIGNQDIERRGLIGMEDYLRSIPGVNQVDKGGKDNAIVIRGISTSPQNENNPLASSGPTVATYFGETPITGAAGMGAGGIDVRPVDMERIEVLRGPQGTAYGSSSLGGTVRMIPAAPQLDHAAGRVAASYSGTSNGGDDNSMIQGSINLPVVADKLALRMVGYRYDESGYYRNIAGIDPATVARAEAFGLGDFVRGYVQDDVGRMVTVGGRLSALWRATDKLELSLNLLTQKIEQDGDPVAYLGAFAQTRMPIVPAARVRGERGEVNDTDMKLANLVLDYDFGWATLTSAASAIDSGSVWAQDVSVFFGPSSVYIDSDFESFTAETRLASRLPGRLQFLGGLFYEDVKEDFFQHDDWAGTPATNNPFFTDPMYISARERDLDQRAVFGELSYDLTRRLTATVGGRYFKYDRRITDLREGGLAGIANGAPLIPIGAGATTVLRGSDDGSTFKGNLTFKPTEDSMLYVSWAQGFRLGKPSGGLLASACDVDNDGIADGTNVSMASTRYIESDSLESLELGVKAGFFERRLSVETSVYRIEWQDLPVTVNVGGNCQRPYVANAGAATSSGVEIQAALRVMDGLKLDFGAGYTKTELTEPGLGAPAGARLPGSPELSASVAAQYDFVVAGHAAFVRADSTYVGEFYGDLLESAFTRAGDYIKLDARAGVAIRNVSVEVFARNLTNEDSFTWRAISTPVLNYRMRPRTIGVQLAYGFQ